MFNPYLACHGFRCGGGDAGVLNRILDTNTVEFVLPTLPLVSNISTQFSSQIKKAFTGHSLIFIDHNSREKTMATSVLSPINGIEGAVEIGVSSP